MRWHAGRCQGEPQATAREHGQEGVTLVEMMVAILVLGVVLAALASSLISFSAMSLTNERRVQATAFLTRLHEQLQSIPWDQAAIYEDEAAELTPMGVNLGVDPVTVGGEPLVLLETPDNSSCPVDEPECGRLTFVPRASDIIEIDGREYELFQAITWDVDAGNGQAVKRFTTLVRWEVWGQVTEQQFESTRAATVSEIASSTLPEVLSLLVTPNSVAIDTDGVNQTPIQVRVIFERGITSAMLQYVRLNGGDPELHTVTMIGTDFEDAKPYAFEVTIPAGSEVFQQGEQDLVVVGLDGLDAISAVRTIEFIETTGGSVPPHVSSVTVNRTFVEVGSNGPDNGRLCQTLTVSALVNNVESSPVPGTVVANYVADTGTGADMTPPGTITGSNDLFTRTFAAGTVSPWKPEPPRGGGPNAQPAKDVTDRFDVIAENPDGTTSSLVSSDQITFRARTGNGRCP